MGNTGGGATYVVAGHVVGGAAGDSRSLNVAETMGREGQAKAKRKFGQDADRQLKALLERDKEGMKAVVRAREVAKIMDEKNGKRVKGEGNGVEKSDKGKGRAKGKEKASTKVRFGEFDDSDLSSDFDLIIEDPGKSNAQKSAYSAQVIKQLGFDPTMKPGQKRADDSTVIKKVYFSCCVQISSIDTKSLNQVGSFNSCSVIAKGDRTRAKTRAAKTFWRHSTSKSLGA
jgi:minichromosome maintenance protein 10